MIGGALFASSFAADRGEAGVRPSPVAPPAVQRSGSNASLPMTIVDGLPTVELMIDGRGPFRFAVDTGQPFALGVTPAAASALGLERTGKILIGAPAGGRPRAVATFRAHRVIAGGLTFSDVEASAGAMTKPGRSAISGTIGMALFEGLTLTIDYGRMRIRVDPKPLPPPDGRRIVQAKIDEMGMTQVPLTIGGATYRVHLDTGNARLGLFMPSTLIAKLPTRGEARAIGTARTVGGEVTLRAIDLAAPVSIGTTRLPVKAVGYPAIASVGNIGSAALAGLAVSIDTRSHRVEIRPSSWAAAS